MSKSWLRLLTSTWRNVLTQKKDPLRLLNILDFRLWPADNYCLINHGNADILSVTKHFYQLLATMELDDIKIQWSRFKVHISKQWHLPIDQVFQRFPLNGEPDMSGMVGLVNLLRFLIIYHVISCQNIYIIKALRKQYYVMSTPFGFQPRVSL